MKQINPELKILIEIVKQGYYQEFVEQIRNDSNLREALLELNKRINWNNLSTYSEEILLLFDDFELDALIRAFTLLDGEADEFYFKSATPVPILFSRLRDLEYSRFEELVDWVFKNTKNPYTFPVGFNSHSESKSLREYRLLEKLKSLKSQLGIIQNNIRGIENQLAKVNKPTADLRGAIKRKDIRAIQTLVNKGAEIYLRESDGKTLAEKIEVVSHSIITKNQNSSRVNHPSMHALEENLYLTSANNESLVIIVRGVAPTKEELDTFDCVTTSARYDNGFGFSQLYRFIDDLDSQAIKIKDYCKFVVKENKADLLPSNMSSRWKVILTPIIKENSDIARLQCQSIMEDIFNLSQQSEIKAKKILISQYRYLRDYRENQFNGVFAAINDFKNKSFGNLNTIYFEIELRYRDRFIRQMRSKFIKWGPSYNEEEHTR